ncbi:MAG: NAD+ synthase (glutamine-hydrolyzing), partial [Sphingobacteriales bacterium]
MKIHLVQANFHIGNFSEIRNKCIAEIELAKTKGADIVIFPEMAATGYPALDLLTYPEFVSQAEELVLSLAKLSTDIAILIGGPETNKAPFGKQLYNSAYFLAEGKVMHVARKMLLPTYDIFDEYRYFQPDNSPSVVQYKGLTIFISICEDLWNEDTHNLYGKGPLDILLESGQKIDLHLNIAASPFDPGQKEKRAKVLLKNAQKGNCPVVYCNHTGTQTELVFDGDCQVIYPSGESYNFPLFQEHSETIKIGDKKPKIESEKLIAIKHRALVAGVKDYFGKLGFKKAILGLSGGIDSALTAHIAKEALGAENVLGVLMPSQFSSGH